MKNCASLCAAIVAAACMAWTGKAKSDVDFLSIANSANMAGINIAGVTLINGAIDSSTNGGSGPTQMQIDALNRFIEQGRLCRRDVILNTPAATPAREAGLARCKAQFPNKRAQEFQTPDAPAYRASSNVTGYANNVPAGSVSGQYRPSAAVATEVQNELYRSLTKISRNQADEVKNALFNQDIERLFGNTVRPFGLEAGNVIDSTTAFWVSMWVISNQAPNPSLQQIAQVRTQVLKVLANEGTLNKSDADKQRLSQGMMFETILGLVAFNNASIDKNALAQATTRNLLRRGLDMRNLVMTDRGFAPR
jgi:hypothetical protein